MSLLKVTMHFRRSYLERSSSNRKRVPRSAIHTELTHLFEHAISNGEPHKTDREWDDERAVRCSRRVRHPSRRALTELSALASHLGHCHTAAGGGAARRTFASEILASREYVSSTRAFSLLHAHQCASRRNFAGDFWRSKPHVVT